MPTARENIEAAMTDAAVNLAALEAAGPQAWVDYSVDGESYQYAAAKTQLLASIEKYKRTLQILDGPIHVTSRGRV
jgi:hypothetical protein